jgi:hypothetical protein
MVPTAQSRRREFGLMATVAFEKDTRPLLCPHRLIKALPGLFEVCSRRALRKRLATHLARHGRQRVKHRSQAQIVALRVSLPDMRDELAHLPLGPPVISRLE